jgi:hypothetical protein
VAGIVTVMLFFLVTAVGVVSIVAGVTIIQKAGYSGWYILTQFVPPLVGWLVALIVVKAVLSTGTPSVDKLFGADLVAVVIMFASLLVSWGFFVAFAFSDWPSLQVRRAGPGGRGPGPGSSGPFGPRPVSGGAPAATVAHSPAPPEGRPPGWHRTGPIGVGEQSYWDGSAWTARRRWQNNAWVDLPAPGVETTASATATAAAEESVGPSPTA